jgi:hypothetical protein
MYGTDRQIDRQTWYTEPHTDTQADTWKDRQTNRQIDRETDFEIFSNNLLYLFVVQYSKQQHCYYILNVLYYSGGT